MEASLAFAFHSDMLQIPSGITNAYTSISPELLTDEQGLKLIASAFKRPDIWNLAVSVAEEGIFGVPLFSIVDYSGVQKPCLFFDHGR